MTLRVFLRWTRHAYLTPLLDCCLRRPRLRHGPADDPDWAYDEEVYPLWVNCDPEIAADSAFGVHDMRLGADAARRTLH